MQNDKTIIAYHFGQCYGLLQIEWRLPKIEIGWLIKVLRNGCFHNEPVICPRLSHNGPRKVILALGVASGQYNLPWAIMTNLGYITGPLWKHPFINTIIIYTTENRHAVDINMMEDTHFTLLSLKQIMSLTFQWLNTSNVPLYEIQHPTYNHGDTFIVM